MELKQGHYYSNGAYGRNWGVRMVLSLGSDPESGEDVVNFKGVAGSSRRQTGAMLMDDFLRWVRYEVRLVENDWKRVLDTPLPPGEGQG
jgi:hypothetical protein